MVYHISSLGDGRTFMAIPVAPPADDRLTNKELRSLSAIHWDLGRAIDFSESITAVENATPEEIELARLQFVHSMKMIGKAMEDQFFRHTWTGGLLHGNENLRDLILTTTKAIASDVEGLLEEVKGAPKDLDNARVLASALLMLAEAKVVARDYAETKPMERKVADEVAKTFDRVAKRYDHFRKSVGPVYAALSEVLPLLKEIEAKAEQRVHEKMTAEAHLTPDQVFRTELEAGDRDTLWHYVQDEKFQAEALEKRWYRPLSSEEAEELRGKVLHVMRAYNETYHDDSYVGLIKQAIVTATYWSLERAQKASNNEWENEIRQGSRRMVAGHRQSKEEAAAELEKSLEDLKVQKAKAAVQGRTLALQAQALRAEYGAILAQVRPEAEVSKNPVVTLTMDGDVVVGRLNTDDSKVLLIYRDPFVDVRGAAYAMAVPTEVIANGIPEFTKEFRDTNFGNATNYYSMDDAVNNITHGDFDQRYFFGTNFEVDDQCGMELVRKR
jgi:hypothetical protein